MSTYKKKNNNKKSNCFHKGYIKVLEAAENVGLGNAERRKEILGNDHILESMAWDCSGQSSRDDYPRIATVI